MPKQSEPALRRRLAAVAVLTALLVPSLVAAQGPGFLFKRPVASLTLRAGYSVPRASSDVFDEDLRLLTLDRSDYNAFAVGGDLAIRLSDRFDAVFGLAYSRAEARSEFADWDAVDGLPIEQETQFTRLPLTGSLKAYLLSTGRSIGRFAWVPARWSPYVGAGGGMMWYRYHQTGEYVDFGSCDDEGCDIIAGTSESTGWTPTAHVMAGADFSLSPRLALNVEGRYGWASDEMSSDFVDFDKIDLAGLQATVGFSVRF